MPVEYPDFVADQMGVMPTEEITGEVEEETGPDPVALEELADHISQLYELYGASTLRQDVLDEIRQSRIIYDQKLEETGYPWPNASNMISPLTRMGVDEIEPRLVSTVIGREPIVKAVHHEGVSTRTQAEQVTKYDNFVLTNKIKVKKKVPKWMHNLLLDGTVFVECGWDIKTRNVRQHVFDLENKPVIDPDTGAQVKVDNKRVEYDGPTVRLVPVEHCFLADDVEDDDWEEKPVIIYDGSYTIEEINRRVERGEEDWLLPEEEELEQDTVDTLVQTSQQESDGAVSDYSKFKSKHKPLECVRAYLNYDIGDGYEPLIVLMTLKSKRIIRLQKQIDVFDRNVKLIRRIRLFAKEGISWGCPIYSINAGIQLGVDAMWNRCINSADIAMTPWGFVKRGLAGNTQNKLIVSPGMFFEVDDPDAYNFPNLTGFNPTQFLPLIMQYISFFERTFNVSDFLQGRDSEISGKKGTTATGTLAVLQEGKVKHEYHGLLIGEQFLDIFILIHDLCAANMSVEDTIPILGEPIQKYTMSLDYSFELVGSDAVSNRFVERKEIEDLMMILAQPPFNEMVNPIVPLQMLLSTYKITDFKELIDPQLNALVQQYIAMKMQVEQMVKMGIPPEVAQQLVSQGVTVEDLMQVQGGMQKALSQAQTQPEGGGQGEETNTGG